MKKFIIIAAIIFTTGLTAFALTRKDNSNTQSKIKIENEAGNVTTQSANNALGTAD